MSLLEVRDLRVTFRLINHSIRAVNGVSFDLAPGEILGLAGESGCGKSATLLSILKLIQPPGLIEPGSSVLFGGRNLAALDEDELAAVRGAEISLIFQEPGNSFNPLFSIGAQIAETIMVHSGAGREQALARAGRLLAEVRIPEAEKRLHDYPFQFSGGMLQRCLIALALANDPAILLADEPTTALDPTTQVQILSLLREERDRRGMAVIFVTHDLELLHGFADRIVVMYAGDVFESSPAGLLLDEPLHPYAADLIAAIPRPGRFKNSEKLYSIPGRVPASGNRPAGCPYHPRCSKAFEACRSVEPPLFQRAGRLVRCWLYE